MHLVKSICSNVSVWHRTELVEAVLGFVLCNSGGACNDWTHHYLHLLVTHSLTYMKDNLQRAFQVENCKEYHPQACCRILRADLGLPTYRQSPYLLSMLKSGTKIYHCLLYLCPTEFKIHADTRTLCGCMELPCMSSHRSSRQPPFCTSSACLWACFSGCPRAS